MTPPAAPRLCECGHDESRAIAAAFLAGIEHACGADGAGAKEGIAAREYAARIIAGEAAPPGWCCNKCGRVGNAPTREDAEKDHAAHSPSCHYLPAWNWKPAEAAPPRATTPKHPLCATWPVCIQCGIYIKPPADPWTVKIEDAVHGPLHRRCCNAFSRRTLAYPLAAHPATTPPPADFHGILSPPSRESGALHAAASDLRHVASGGTCAPETLRAHADALLALERDAARMREAAELLIDAWREELHQSESMEAAINGLLNVLGPKRAALRGTHRAVSDDR